ncbi:MAG: cardiolipin synthase [Paludibacteraceae bacterium]|nr:cardiolipin synthase [Paludibacteraceae bacterium]
MSLFLKILYWALLALYWYAIIASIGVVILENKRPVRAIAWILVLIFLPYIGLLFYIVFGRSSLRQGRVARKIRKTVSTAQAPAISHTLETDQNPLLLKYSRLVSLLHRNCESELYANNRIDLFIEGKPLLDAMIAEMEKAENHIHVEYFIVESDETGEQFKDVLVKKAKAGVEVRLIYDDLGSWHLNRKMLHEMREAGVKLQSFFKVRFPFFTTKLNYRNHRKILIIDGKVAFTGGFNIADRYTHGLEWGVWRDTHMRVEGDAVAGLQSIFLNDWLYMTGKIHRSERFYPISSVQNTTYAQMAGSGPDLDWESIMMGMCHAIHGAVSYVYIQSPYFLPNESILNALQSAALAGVDVRLMIPLRSDSHLSHSASLSYMSQLLDAGVKVYQYKKGFIHAKTIVIDGDLSIVGSANMDYRSFEQDFEVSAFIYDCAVARSMTEIFKQDIKNSQRLHRASWKKRPFYKRFLQAIARLSSPAL